MAVTIQHPTITPAFLQTFYRAVRTNAGTALQMSGLWFWFPSDLTAKAESMTFAGQSIVTDPTANLNFASGHWPVYKIGNWYWVFDANDSSTDVMTAASLPPIPTEKLLDPTFGTVLVESVQDVTVGGTLDVSGDSSRPFQWHYNEVLPFFGADCDGLPYLGDAADLRLDVVSSVVPLNQVSVHYSGGGFYWSDLSAPVTALESGGVVIWPSTGAMDHVADYPDHVWAFQLTASASPISTVLSGLAMTRRVFGGESDLTAAPTSGSLPLVVALGGTFSAPAG